MKDQASNRTTSGVESLIVKRFPKGYTVFNNAMQKVLTPCECSAVISHHGTNAEGLEVYILETGIFHRHFQQGIQELQYIRENGVDYLTPPRPAGR